MFFFTQSLVQKTKAMKLRSKNLNPVYEPDCYIAIAIYPYRSPDNSRFLTLEVNGCYLNHTPSFGKSGSTAFTPWDGAG